MVTKINSESELVRKLQEDVSATEKSSIKIFAGHLPLLYHDNGPGKRHVELGVNRWGLFSPYSFELGCMLAKYSETLGKGARLIVLVDDEDELRRDGKEKRKDEHKWKSPRRKFFRESGLPEEYLTLLKNYGLDTSHLMTTENQQGIVTPLISERQIKRQGERAGIVAVNECSKAYKGLLLTGQVVDISRDYLISMIPGQCKGNICQGVIDPEEIRFDSSHAFFPSARLMGGLVLNETTCHYVQFSRPCPKELIYYKGIDYVKTP